MKTSPCALKVDIVAYDDDQAVSGPASWAVRMPPLLRERGLDVRLLLLNWGCGEHGMIARACRNTQVPYFTQKFGSTDENIRWILSKIKQQRPDIFICNHVIPGLLLGGTLKDSGIPSVGILRSDDPFYHAMIERFVAGRAKDALSAIVGVSQFLSDLARSANSNLIVDTICSGTPVRNETARWQTPLNIVYAGRFIDEQKRIHLTTEALINTCREVPGTSAVMIGEGPALKSVQERISKSGAPIRVTGRVDPGEATRLIGGAQVQVLFSDYEGLPTSLLEGMSAGVVPICTNMRSGIQELVNHGLTGFIISDPRTDLPAVIRSLSTERATWESISASARQRVLSDFSLDASADRWVDLIQRLHSTRNKSLEIPATVADICPPDPRFAREDNRTANSIKTQTTGIGQKAIRFLKRLVRSSN